MFKLNSAKLFIVCVSCLFLSFSVYGQEDVISENIPSELTIEPNAGTSDQAIKKKLESIFQQIDELKNVSVEVVSGVVTLSGIVDDSDSENAALTLTKKTAGVIYVRDQIEENVEVAARLAPAQEKAREMGRTFIQKLPLIGIAIGVITLFWLVGGWLSRRKSIFKKLRMNEMASSLARNLIKLTFVSLGIFIGLEILDASAIASAILGVAGVAGIALGFAFRNIVENYLAGVLLSIRNPFSTGDVIEVSGMKGKVIRLTSRDTVLMTMDGNHLRIPNSAIMTSAMTNFSRNPLRRFDFAVGVSVELDLIKVRELGMETLLSLKSILSDPAPTIVVEALGDSTVNMRFYAWIDQRDSDFSKAKSEAIRLIKDRFDDQGIEMPEPIYRVHLKDAYAPQEMVAESQPAQPSQKRIQGEMDTSADTSLDKQIEAAEEMDAEKNLLD
ncbi:mechanosensitive ion channel family protein [Rubritalea sp.]|uniref:mechanosensitive ion channel family protein n=1 Tax=Rubritalea sp. TaxID=2109375 RepID=UPI003EF83D26